MGNAPASVEASGGQRGEAGAVAQTVVWARLVDANTAATAFYREQLLGPTGEGPARYLTSRGLGHVMGRNSVWQVGYAPQGWTVLLEHLQTAGFTGREVLAAGLARRTRRGTLIDTFRDRVMCPVREETGAVAGFIGRAAPAAGPDVPKYLNTSDTALYR
jgi:DNA primase